jgi:hypothetical protein
MFFGIKSVSQVTWKTAAGFFGLLVLLSLPVSAFAEDDPVEDLDESDETPPEARKDPDTITNTSISKSVAEKPPGVDMGAVRLELGAPRPSAQTPGIAAAPPPPPGQATIKVGGGFILASFNPYGLKENNRQMGIPNRKPYMEAFRAALFLDSKVDRWGAHIEFRMRDKKVRNFYDGTAWLEEIYGSADIITADNTKFGPMSLRVGKTYTQFGKFWDDQFYGNPQLRDGLKLDSNYGVSLDGTLGAKKVFGTKYWGQYFVIDGGTNTSSDGRDTISNPAPSSGYPTGTNPLARRRNIINGRIEPFLQFSETMWIKFGGSLQNFTADFGPTMKQENVIRYAGDMTVNLKFISFWGEFTQQDGKHVLAFPFAASPAIVAGDPYGRAPRGATPARSANKAHYALAGIKATWKGISLRYHFSMADYMNILYPAPAGSVPPGGVVPTITVREMMHTPAITLAVIPQLTLMIEAPVHKRYIPAAPSLGIASQEFIVDKQVVITLHARI